MVNIKKKRVVLRFKGKDSKPVFFKATQYIEEFTYEDVALVFAKNKLTFDEMISILMSNRISINAILTLFKSILTVIALDACLEKYNEKRA
jgi:hypothetical protein